MAPLAQAIETIRRVADHAGEVADQELDLVAELLEVPQLVDDHRVAEVQIGSGRVQPQLDAELAAALKLFDEFLLDDHVFATPTDGLNSRSEAHTSELQSHS